MVAMTSVWSIVAAVAAALAAVTYRDRRHQSTVARAADIAARHQDVVADAECIIIEHAHELWEAGVICPDLADAIILPPLHDIGPDDVCDFL